MIAPEFPRAAISVSSSVSVSVFVIIAPRFLGAAVSVSEIVAGRLRAAVCVSVSVIIAPRFGPAAVCVSVFEMTSAGGRLAVAIDIPFENCSHGHFSGLGGESRSLLRRVYSASIGTGLAFKAGRRL